ncbi:MAG: energy-coupling factor ABC transporter permease [Verrucomicrobiota bacterium]|nr:energy-coupling factor ABC transporter permease [Limisphaera sp.]MDW8382931.1 energy-coupling factor ABC transporter permease [Verrucomicrobiota bacterium]
MHIPDNFLDLKTVAVTTALAAGAVGLALRQTRSELPPARVPLLGLSAAFVFVAQMLNFPVLAGTSGHLAGGVLVASLLGPAAAVVVMTCVLIVQCFLFSDGGLTTLGANILNLGVLGAVGGWLAAQAVACMAGGLSGRVAGVAFGGWLSMVLAATACALELAWSRTVSLSLVLPAMVGIHAVIGLAEGLISALVFAAVARLRPDWIEAGSAASSRSVEWWPWALILCCGLAILAAPWASTLPDGLDKVAEEFGFAEKARACIPAPLADYTMPGIGVETVAVAGAGLTGLVAVLALSLVLGRLLTRPSSGAIQSPEEPARSS